MASFTSVPDPDAPKRVGTPIVAIDFGTSRTAYSYGFVGQQEPIHKCPENSVANEGTQMKAETCVVLDSRDGHKAVGFGEVGRRTYLAENASSGNRYKIFKYFKMYLKNIVADGDDPHIPATYGGGTAPLSMVVARALSYVAQSAIETMNSQRPAPLTMQQVHWIVTVPAIWSPAGTGFMRAAAVTAGLIDYKTSQRLTLVREPDGACTDMLADAETPTAESGLPRVQLPPGVLQLAVLDCGGGTNDMTFVAIVERAPRMTARELCPATGGSHGAAIINARLGCIEHINDAAAGGELSLLDDLFGVCNDAPGLRRITRLRQLEAIADIEDKFEAFKLTFSGGEAVGQREFVCRCADLMEDYSERFPADAIDNKALARLIEAYNQRHPVAEQQLASQRGRFDIPSTVIRRWFDAVIDGIINDLRLSLRRRECSGISHLLLVGGFNCNPYLYERVKEAFGPAGGGAGAGGRVLNITRAAFPDLAIVRGAGRMGLVAPGQHVSGITHFKAPCCYGIEVSNVFDASKHDSNKRGVDERVAVYDVHVVQGDDVVSGQDTPDHVYWPIGITQKSMAIRLMKLALPPDTAPGTVTSGSLIYADDPRLRKHVTAVVTMDMSLATMGERAVKVCLHFHGTEALPVIRRESDGSVVTDAEVSFHQ